jgi:ribonuclease D
MKPVIKVHQDDLPEGLDFGQSVAIDTEAMGLNHHRDRLCLVQLSAGDGVSHIVQLNKSFTYKAPNLSKLLKDPKVLKIFHYARFDVGILKYALGVDCAPIYCTKVASKLCRTFTDRHSLRDLCRDLLGVEISKEQQTSDWGNPDLKREQLEYAATDVLHLHRLKLKLDELLKREGRQDLAQDCFKFLSTCIKLDLLGYNDFYVFQH